MSAVDGRFVYGFGLGSITLPTNASFDNLTVNTSLISSKSSTFKDVTITGTTNLETLDAASTIIGRSDVKIIRPNTGTQAAITLVTGSTTDWICGSALADDSFSISNNTGSEKLNIKQTGDVKISGPLAVTGTTTLAATNTGALTCTTLAPSGTSTLQKTDTQALTCTTLAPTGTSTLQKTDTQALTCTTFAPTGASSLKNATVDNLTANNLFYRTNLSTGYIFAEVNRLTTDAPQKLTNATTTKLSFERIVASNQFTFDTYPYTWLIPSIRTRFIVVVNVEFDAIAAGMRCVEIITTNSVPVSTVHGEVWMTNNGTANTKITTMAIVDMSAGDNLYIYVIQTCGGDLNVLSSQVKIHNF